MQFVCMLSRTQVALRPEWPLTDVLEAEGSAAGPAWVVIPGNPGVVDYYGSFLTRLASVSGRRALGASHVGHGRGSQWRAAGVEEQRRHLEAFLDWLVAHGGVSEWILLGHSLGCTLLLDVLRRRPDLLGRTKGAVSLFPLLADFPDLCGWQIALVRHLSLPLAAVGCALDWLPRFAQRMLVHAAQGDLSDEAKDVSLLLLRGRAVRNVFGLAASEHAEIRAWPDLAFADERFTFVYTTDDRWGPLRHADRLRSEGHRVVMAGEDVAHAFVVHHSEETADLVLGLFAEK